VEGAEVILLGGVEDVDICKEIVSMTHHTIANHSGSQSIYETARHLDSCSILVSNDSAAVHLAAARRVPVVALYGSTVPQLGFTPFNVLHETIGVDLACRPCTHIGRAECPEGHFQCMNNLSVARVFSAVRHIEEQLQRQS
jgi:heptosyltransferase-2